LLSVQTGSEAHPGYPKGTGGSFPGVKLLVTHLRLVTRLQILELYLHSPTPLHGVVINWLSTGITLSLYHWGCSDWLWGPQHFPVQWILSSFPGFQRPKLTIAYVNNVWSHAFTAPIRIHGMTLKHTFRTEVP
jgi:hypothetical protein